MLRILPPAHAPDQPAGERASALRLRRAGAFIVVAGFGAAVPATPGACADIGAALASGETPLATDITGLVILLLLFFSVLTASLHLIGRRRWTQRESELAAELARTRAGLDRANLFLASEPQILVAWDRPDSEPRIEGDFALVADAPLPRRVLAFSSWLEPALAATVQQAVERLLGRGEAFSIAAGSLKGRHFEIEGRAVAGYAVVRIRDVSGDRLQLARLRDSHTAAVNALAALRALLDAIPHPAWTRDGEGRLTWSNLAYSRAVEAKDAAEVANRNLELFDQDLCAEALVERRQSGAWRRRAPAVVAGERKMFEVVEIAAETGAAGIANDLSPLESLRAEMDGHAAAYSRMLDQLSTAVAIFDRAKRLTFYNAAYRQIWSLDAGFLDSQPTDGEVLDRLRAKRQLPEQADFRSWKAQALAAYQAIEPIETVWHLPDGRALAGRGEPQSARRRHLSLRRRDAELRARFASHRLDARARRNARRAEGRRGGVRRRRADEAHQSRLRRTVALRAVSAPPIARTSTRSRAIARRCSPTRRCGTGCARRSSACRTIATDSRCASSARTAWSSIAPRCRCPTARRCSPSST